ncbi:MAG: hypothetical protein ACRC68_01090 [Clostridium sp.]
MQQVDFTKLIPVIFVLAGIYLLVRAYLIGSKKKIKLISGIDEKTLKRIKNIDKLTKDYSRALTVVALACFIAVIFLLYLGFIGKILGIAVILLSSVKLSRVTLDMDTKIKRKIY